MSVSIHRSVLATMLALFSFSVSSLHAAAPPPTDTSTQDAQKKLEAAQERLEQAAREVAELSTRMAGKNIPDTLMFLGRNPNRAMLGIAIGGKEKGQDADDGVTVLSVSPGGPAADAGIKAGDVILELNGKSLKAEKDQRPNEKLLDELTKMKPGDEASIRYRRDGKVSTAKLKVESLPPHQLARVMKFNRHFDGNEPSDEEFDFPFTPGFPGLRGGLGQLELIPLSPKLGQYFGTDKGLLVVRTPSDKDIKLEDGDVVLDIDGRVPSNPGHAFRILHSYQPGEKVTLNVLRQRKKTAVTITMPDEMEHRMERRIERRIERGPQPPPPPKATPPAPTPTGARLLSQLAVA